MQIILVIVSAMITVNIPLFQKQPNSDIDCNRDQSIKQTEVFEEFYGKFNSDPEFQMTRITFPLKKLEFDEDGVNLVERSIKREDWKIIRLGIQIENQSRVIDRYSEEKIIENKLVQIILKGIDNGIYVEYQFIEQQYKWMLNKVTDYSN